MSWARRLALLLALVLHAPSGQAQVNDDELLELTKPRPGSANNKTPQRSEPIPFSADEGAPSKPSDGPEPSAAPSAGEASDGMPPAPSKKKARKKQAEQVTDKVRSSSVKPADARSIEPSAQEKGAARETVVDTIANSPAASEAVERGRQAERRGKPRRGRAGASATAPAKPAIKKTAYDIAREKWHAPAQPELCAEFKASEVPNLVFHIQGKNLTYSLQPMSRRGGWDETQLAIAKEAFGGWAGGPTPHPRMLDLVYGATLHFGCPYVTLISGIRKDRGGSRHSHGLAADVVLPGVDDEELAAFFRAQGFVGVGTYPRSGFVHVDTRDQSFFWIDHSKPNQRGRVVQVRREESTAVDEAARARGEAGFVNPPRLQKALHVRATRRMRQHRAKLAAKAAREEKSRPNAH